MDLFNYQNQNIKNHFQRSTRIDNDLTKDFLDHFESRQKISNGKAMVVCLTRSNCIKFYGNCEYSKYLKELKP